MKKLAAAAAAFAALALGTSGYAAAPAPAAVAARRPANAEDELKQLHRDIAATKLDKLLNLSREQARGLLPILQEGARQLEQQKAEHEKRAPAIARALLAVKEDVKRDGVVSEANKKALKEARGDEQQKAVHQQGKELREKARAIFTPEQQKSLREFNPAPLQPALREQGEHGPREHGPRGGKGERGGRGWDRDGGEGEGPHHGGGRGKMMLITLSPEFIGMVQARAK